ncbi:acyltransferase 3 [Clostridium sp. DL-VIII]|uniref:acyltransferase family protein n=1 Tax=Clostridium sp. DL-VIII TaxID=641107 RepID=UPI00023B0731|nr:acyltransferase family protein [Clostridium sp. DL-VIII]EHJ02130.1 acyltransferase 3 [Clostridium sp. DL-VIII]
MSNYSNRLLYTLEDNSIELKKDKMGRILFWDNLKFLLILVVVVGHFADFYSTSSMKMKELFLFIYIFHMPLFIFVSGYFSKKIINVKQFKIEKVFSYLVLYFLLKVCFFILNKYLFGKVETYFTLFNENGVPWYLLAMSIWLCLTYVVKDIKSIYVLFSSILISVLAGYDKTVGDFICLSRILVFFPYFVVGYYISEERLIKILKCNWLKCMSLIFLLITIIAICMYGQNLYQFRGYFTGRNSYIVLNEPLYGGVYRILFYGLSVIISLGVIFATPKCNVFFTKFGSRTLQVYFLHYLILSLYIHYKLNDYLIKSFPKSWKFIYLCLAIMLTYLLSLKMFEYPFKRIMGINLNKLKVSQYDM